MLVIAVNWNSPAELCSRELSTRCTTYQSHLFKVLCFHNKTHKVIPAFSRLCVTVTGFQPEQNAAAAHSWKLMLPFPEFHRTHSPKW
ncbi:hypothetical protein QQF64_027227 [Cirrhinus molitorella]|uniref:Uncharacterized protein n=1 Tax=Cirrhinus molitorella TaxID=172907 RepID=A0ABR3NBT3_9TELE